MALGQAKLLHRRTGKKIAIGDGFTVRWSDVFNGVKYLATQDEVNRGAPVEWLHNYSGCRPYIDYDATAEAGWRKLRDPRHDTPYRRAIKLAGRWVFKNFQPEPAELVFTEGELALGAEAARVLGDFVIVEPHNKHRASPGKSWGWQRYADLVAALHGVRMVQLGPSGTLLLPGAVHFPTGQFRHACAVMARARAYVGPEGGLHHAAAAVGTPAVVIFGGYIGPHVTGYPGHVNIYSPAGSPCGSREPCQHCIDAMANITVKTVEKAVRDVLSRRTKQGGP